MEDNEVENSNDALSLELQKNDVGEETTLALRSTFMPFFEEANELAKQAKAIVVTSENQTDEMDKAREMRLALKVIRVTADKERKALKEEVVRKGKAIDGMANIIKFLIVPVEEHLQKQEDFVKVREARRKEELRAKRDMELQQYDMPQVDRACYNLSEMSEEGYQQLRSSWKMTFENKLKLEREVEFQRVAAKKAEVEERAKVAAENEKLRAEAEHTRKKQQDKLAKERAKLKAEREERQNLETELEEAKQEKIKIEEAEAEAKAKAQQAPDKEKLEALAVTITKIEMPAPKSDKALEILRQVCKYLSSTSDYIRQECLNL